MFGFGKKIEKDPKKAIENADNAINSGVTGFLTKTFMGKDFVDQANAGLNMAKNYTDTGNLAQTGMGATADVLSIADTGALINYNPVVKMKLNITPQFGPAFQADVETAVSKIAIPRVGDKINIKYNPANTSQVLVI
ncbi:MAG: hypothetical protein IT281_01195 [Ignavibacteria bacterium]|nr:hypothetical protein [Ignavibacteria bacterium]MCC7158136.1 hypothetical protein [Ignavibacteria bacterium]